jgi:hypothetical protein
MAPVSIHELNEQKNNRRIYNGLEGNIHTFASFPKLQALERVQPLKGE